ncbi:MAG: response regulator [Pseudomonadota bacterium]
MRFPGRPRILVIDDEKLVRDVITLILEKLGCRTTGFDSSRQAYEAFRDEPFEFDLVIADQNMPGLTGTNLALVMKAIRPDLPFIICTGKPCSDLTREAELAGVNKVVGKPLGMIGLAGLLETALKT